MQDFTLAAITDAEKMKLRCKIEQSQIEQSQWTVKYMSRAPGHGACLKDKSRTITMQGLTLAAITDEGKPNFDVNVEGLTDRRTDEWTDGNLNSYIAPFAGAIKLTIQATFNPCLNAFWSVVVK